MSEAPERIWAGPSVGWQLQATWKNGDWDLDGETISYAEFGVEYLRADIAAAEIERLRAALEAIYQMTTSLTDPEHIRQRMVEVEARAALAEKGE